MVETHPPTGSSTGAVERRSRTVSATQQALQERLAQVLGEPLREVLIEDPQAIRALAHGARQRVIEVLYAEQRPYTATQLAEQTGLTPSAMSYHLRALERWGVVVRAGADGDSRERPWRAAGSVLAVAGSGPAASAATDAMLAQAYRGLQRRARLARQLPPERRTNVVGLATADLWLTDEQVEVFANVVDRAIVDLFESGWTNEPAPGRTRMSLLWSLLPDPAEGAEPAGGAGTSSGLGVDTGSAGAG